MYPLDYADKEAFCTAAHQQYLAWQSRFLD
jgi:hypothetical protein